MNDPRMKRTDFEQDPRVIFERAIAQLPHVALAVWMAKKAIPERYHLACLEELDAALAELRAARDHFALAGREAA